MSRHRKLVWAAVAGLLVHAAVLLTWGTRSPGPLLSNSIEFLLGVAAALAALDAARRSTRFARHVWYLTSFGLWIYAAGQGMVIYFDNVANAPILSPWISDEFLFFWVVPLVAAAIMDSLEEPRALDAALLLDIVQVILIGVAIHLAEFAVPAKWQTQGQAMAFLAWKVRMLRDVLVLLAIFGRATLTPFRQTRQLFLRIGFYFLTYAFADATYLYIEAKWEIRSGTWADLLWSVPRVLFIVLALTWVCTHGEEFEEQQLRQKARSRMLHVVPVAAPLLVVVALAQLMATHPLMATLLLIASVACASVRLLITLHRQELAVHALRTSEARYRSLFERNMAGVFRSSVEGRMVDCNEAFLRMFGYTREELLGQPSWVLYPGGEAERDSRLADLRRAGQFTNYEMCYRRKDGGLVWTLQNVLLSHDEAGNPVTEGTVVDITERHKLEEQFLQAQKMEAVGRLAGGVAHDFNNLLTVMKGYSQLLEDRLQSDPTAASECRQIHEAADRAAALTRQLLAFSRQQVLNPQVLNLNTTLANVERLLRRLIGEDIDLLTQYGAGLWSVKADPGQIEQVVMNLAVNARDAMPNGGKLLFETENCQITEERRPHPIMTPGPYVMLTVTDTGHGMNAETQNHIFEPFYTTKKLGEGTGLGLSTVYGILKQSNGYIWVES